MNSEYLSVFEESLTFKNKKQLDQLDKDIEGEKRRAAANGLLKSGAMINGVKGLCIKVLESRVDYIFEILNDLSFKYSRNLGKRISQIVLKYFPEDLGELYTRLDDVIRLSNREGVRDHIINEAVNANKSEIERFRNKLNQFLLNLGSKKISPIKKFWENPVWSKVIASAICGIFVLCFIYIYLCWKYSLVMGPLKFAEIILGNWIK